MIDKELQQLLHWRYCNVTNGEKTPCEQNWQKNPRSLDNIYTNNIGVILGTASSGICAIDFDGVEAIDHWTNTFGIDISTLDTVMWTSGKEYRCQAAFTVDQEYWSVLKKKVVNKLEFRWNGCQSVLPPSKLNDGREYFWINSPTTHVTQQLPDIVLEYWLKLVYEDITRYDNVVISTYQTSQYDEKFVDELLSRISGKVGNLRGDYDVWRTIAWATCHTIGMDNAYNLMMRYWPEKTKKEIKTLTSWKHRSDSPTIGTLIKLSGISKKDLYELQVKYGYKEDRKIKGISRDVYNFNRG